MGFPGAPPARAAGAAAAGSTAAAAAGSEGGAGGFSADDLERARASFRVLLEVACHLLPARDSHGKTAVAAATPGGAAAAGGGLQTSVLLLLTRLCEESWAPELLAEMIVAAQRHRADFLRRAAAEKENYQ